MAAVPTAAALIPTATARLPAVTASSTWAKPAMAAIVPRAAMMALPVPTTRSRAARPAAAHRVAALLSRPAQPEMAAVRRAARLSMTFAKPTREVEKT